MPVITSHKPGSFCWFELGTTDQEAAKKFYGSLFAWSATDLPMGPDGYYTMFKLDGQDAAAAYTVGGQMAPNVPPHWALYIAVQSADDAAGRVEANGGKLLKPSFDVFDAGRMAVAADPAGAPTTLRAICTSRTETNLSAAFLLLSTTTRHFHRTGSFIFWCQIAIKARQKPPA